MFIYRTIEDLELMHAYSRKATRGAVIGGGLLGLEAAKAMMDLGITNTQVIEFAPRLMPRQLDETGSRVLCGKLENLGLTIHTSKNTARILGDDFITGMRFSDDSSIEVDMLVISAGIKPRDELAQHCGLAIGPRGGIVVDENMLTNDTSILAIGECALYKGMIYGLVAPGYEMAEVAIAHITGRSKQFAGYDMSTKLKLIGVDVASFGDPFITGEESRTIVFEDTVKGLYKRINVSKDGKYLLGGILVGDASAYNMMLQTCKNRIVLSPNPEDIMLGSRGGAESSGAGVADLPEDAIICSCESVTKAEICDSVTKASCETIDAIKKCTKAGTGCAGCVPMVKDLMLHILKSQGK